METGELRRVSSECEMDVPQASYTSWSFVEQAMHVRLARKGLLCMRGENKPSKGTCSDV
jgi:hypothetical protein